MSRAPAVQERPVEQVEIGVPTCQHHWVIDSPRGAMSEGRCKRCGELREFRNSANDHLWENDSGSGYNPWRGIRSNTSGGGEEDEIAASSRSSNKAALSV